MHHFALLLAIGVPLHPGGYRCGCAGAHPATSTSPAPAASTAPASMVTAAPAPRAAVIPKYGALAAQPSAMVGPHPVLAGSAPDPTHPGTMPAVRPGILRAAASVLRMTTRPNAAPLGGPMRR